MTTKAEIVALQKELAAAHAELAKAGEASGKLLDEIDRRGKAYDALVKKSRAFAQAVLDRAGAAEGWQAQAAKERDEALTARGALERLATAAATVVAMGRRLPEPLASAFDQIEEVRSRDYDDRDVLGELAQAREALAEVEQRIATLFPRWPVLETTEWLALAGELRAIQSFACGGYLELRDRARPFEGDPRERVRELEKWIRLLRTRALTLSTLPGGDAEDKIEIVGLGVLEAFNTLRRLVPIAGFLPEKDLPNG